jgi:hypothetical protein
MSDAFVKVVQDDGPTFRAVLRHNCIPIGDHNAAFDDSVGQLKLRINDTYCGL